MIRVEHLYKAYKAEQFVLNDVNCTIGKGEVVAVIGASGSGKSTFINCLNLLERPTGGNIFIDGEEITAPSYNPDKLRQKVGMVFQDFRLFEHLNVLDNITLAPMMALGMSREEAETKAMELLKSVGLAKKAKTMPKELSGGQKQRVAIARTLAMNPQIILFDEPTSALDPLTMSEVLSVIHNLAKKGYTIVIVTHRISFIGQIADRVFFMHKGTIWEEGPTKQVIEAPRTEETRMFIKRIRGLHYEIEGEDFDLYQLNTTLLEFGMKHFFSKERIVSLYHILEEVLAILNKEKGIVIDMEYSGHDKSVSLRVLQKGEKITLDEESGIDPIALAIIKGFCQSLECRPYEEGTEILISVAE